MSWLVAYDPRFALKADAEYGVAVKNYIDQSQEFALCAVVLAYPVIVLLRAKKPWLAALLMAVSLKLRRQHGVRQRIAHRVGDDAGHARGICVWCICDGGPIS